MDDSVEHLFDNFNFVPYSVDDETAKMMFDTLRKKPMPVDDVFLATVQKVTIPRMFDTNHILNRPQMKLPTYDSTETDTLLLPVYVNDKSQLMSFKVSRPSYSWFAAVTELLRMKVDVVAVMSAWPRFENPMRLPAKPKFNEYMDGPSHQSGWRVLAQLLTGSVEDWMEVRRCISNCIFNCNVFKPELQLFHLQYLTRYLDCRFGIYNHKTWMLIGEWKSDNCKPSILLEHNEMKNEYNIIKALF